MKQMYKVFFNERLIRICPKGKIVKNLPYVIFNASSAAGDIKNWFASFIKNDINEILLIHPEPDMFLKIFRSAFKEIPAAGGVVFSGKMVLFIYRNGKWDLPKGKIDTGEKPEEAAIREVAEECGIYGHKIVKPLMSTFHIYSLPSVDSKSQWIFKETYWFEMDYNGPLAGVPQSGEGITEVRWIHTDDLKEVFGNTYENLKLLLKTSYGNLKVPGSAN